MVVGSIGDVEISIVNLYAPNEVDQNFFKEIANIIANNARGMIVVGGGGDFNAVQDSELDKTPTQKGPQTKKTKILNDMTSELGLVDP